MNADVIPADTVSCTRCGGTIAMLDVLTDELCCQVRAWHCVEHGCGATGWIGLAIGETHRLPSVGPKHVIEPRQRIRVPT